MTAAQSADLARDQLFPVLSPALIERLAAQAKRRQLADGERLFSAGDRSVPLYVVLEGVIEVRVEPGDHLIVAHGPGEFTGEITQVSSRRVVVHGRAAGVTRVLEVPHDTLRTLLQTDAELSEVLLRAFIRRRASLVAEGFGDMVLVGSSHSAETLNLREFLTRNGHPHVYLDVERDEGVEELLTRVHVTPADVPIVIQGGREALRNPSIAALADILGIDELHDQVHDLVVVGAGPAGLASAVYGASEGLSVTVLEANAPGGQAGSSSRIENYLGFPTGLSGEALAARASIQAEKFGANLSVGRVAARLHCQERPYRLELASGGSVLTRAIIIATGARYRRIAAPNLAQFEGVGIYYGATQVEANLCKGDDVIVVGGGNSAGQAAVFLSSRARKVHLWVRAEGLAATMSRYLIRRIEETPNIELRPHTEIVGLEGDNHLERVQFTTGAGAAETLHVRHAFLMIGAAPNTVWLDGCLALDAQGFIRTGPELSAAELAAANWPLKRAPLLFETSQPGVFAVGDVRSESVKRVAAAVGEGSVCVQLVHKVLAE